MIDLEHFVTKSVRPAARGSCLCLLIDTKWGLVPQWQGSQAAQAPSPGLQGFMEAGGEAWGGVGVGDRKQRVARPLCNTFSALRQLWSSS